MTRPTYEQIRKWFYYHETSGDLVWWCGKFCGKQAGWLDDKGYIRLNLGGVYLRAHSIIWLYMKGRWPPFTIDHKDRNRGNNSWINLREATSGQNLANRPKQKNNTSGFKGVFRHRKRWDAKIKVAGKNIHIGRFDTKSEAAEAYQRAAIIHQGEFAYTQPRIPVS